jgi:hypothetical protein
LDVTVAVAVNFVGKRQKMVTSWRPPAWLMEMRACRPTATQLSYSDMKSTGRILALALSSSTTTAAHEGAALGRGVRAGGHLWWSYCASACLGTSPATQVGMGRQKGGGRGDGQVGCVRGQLHSCRPCPSAINPIRGGGGRLVEGGLQLSFLHHCPTVQGGGACG